MLLVNETFARHIAVFRGEPAVAHRPQSIGALPGPEYRFNSAAHLTDHLEGIFSRTPLINLPTNFITRGREERPDMVIDLALTRHYLCVDFTCPDLFEAF